MMNAMHRSLGLTLLLGGLAACTSSGPASGGGTSTPAPVEPAPASEPEEAPVAAPATEPAPVVVAEHTLDADLTDKWKQWASERSTKIIADHPELKKQLDALQVQRGRDGQPRVNAEWLSNPDAGPLLLERLIEAGDIDLRLGLAGAVAKSAGVPTQALADLATSANDPGVRTLVVAQLWRRDEVATRDALSDALGDDEVSVRVAAITASSRHPQGRSLVDALAGVLDDASPEVRWVTARALSAVGEPKDATRLEVLLDDAHPRVRRVALRAIDRMDPALAKSLVQSKKLTADSDAAVARVAASIASR